jgi:hypothetical protein
MPRNTAVFQPTLKGTGVMRSDDITGDPRYGGTRVCGIAGHLRAQLSHRPVRDRRDK